MFALTYSETKRGPTIKINPRATITSVTDTIQSVPYIDHQQQCLTAYNACIECSGWLPLVRVPTGQLYFHSTDEQIVQVVRLATKTIEVSS